MPGGIGMAEARPAARNPRRRKVEVPAILCEAIALSHLRAGKSLGALSDWINDPVAFAESLPEDKRRLAMMTVRMGRYETVLASFCDPDPSAACCLPGGAKRRHAHHGF